MEKHTITPWKLASDIPGDQYSVNILGGQYNGTIANTNYSVYFDYEVAEANAAHIVKCVNSHDELVNALNKIAEWQLPETGLFWDNKTQKEPMSYEAAYGSNGVRDYIKSVAKDALNKLNS